jgi:hypothetical protein
MSPRLNPSGSVFMFSYVDVYNDIVCLSGIQPLSSQELRVKQIFLKSRRKQMFDNVHCLDAIA